MRLTRLMAALAIAALVVSTPGSGAAQTTVFRTTLISGGGLVIWCCDPATGIGGFVFVGQVGNLQDPDGFLLYVLIRAGELLEGGIGMIPKSDVRGSAFGSLSVRTDTSLPNSNFTRFAGNGGLVEIDVKKTGGFTRRITGVQLFTFGTTRLHMNGSETTAGATGQGFVILAPIAGLMTAEWSTNRQATLEVVRTP